jgi:hypothetical protein
MEDQELGLGHLMIAVILAPVGACGASAHVCQITSTTTNATNVRKLRLMSMTTNAINANKQSLSGLTEVVINVLKQQKPTAIIKTEFSMKLPANAHVIRVK